jgi:hypothetical protein
LYVEIPFYFTQVSGLAFPLIASIYSKILCNFYIRSLKDIVICSDLVDLKYKNRINMSFITEVIYLDDKEREIFGNMRHEYLYQRKIYNTPIQLNSAIRSQPIHRIFFDSPVKDYFYYVQLDKMIKSGQYYNMTIDYLLPELYMSTSNKILYIQQQILGNKYDSDIYNLYLKLHNIQTEKIFKIKYKAPFIDLEALGLDLFNLNFLAKNITLIESSMIETEFDAYYEKKLKINSIIESTLYMNSIKRYSVEGIYTNLIIPFQSYNNLIPGLHIYNFSLYPNEYQPSGYANLYGLKTDLQITLGNISNLSSTDVLYINVIARSYNIMRHIGGITGMAWQ